jgi:hypothetical protein
MADENTPRDATALKNIDPADFISVVNFPQWGVVTQLVSWDAGRGRLVSPERVAFLNLSIGGCNPNLCCRL